MHKIKQFSQLLTSNTLKALPEEALKAYDAARIEPASVEPMSRKASGSILIGGLTVGWFAARKVKDRKAATDEVAA